MTNTLQADSQNEVRDGKSRSARPQQIIMMRHPFILGVAKSVRSSEVGPVSWATLGASLNSDLLQIFIKSAHHDQTSIDFTKNKLGVYIKNVNKMLPRDLNNPLMLPYRPTTVGQRWFLSF